MQLHAIYTSSWKEGDIHTNAVICTISRSIVECDVSEEGADYEHHNGDAVQIEHDGEYYGFECEQGDFTEQGKKSFERILDEKLIKQYPYVTKGSGGVERPHMTDKEIKVSVAGGACQCIVEAQSDGTICWDINDSREREPIHNVKKGDRFWCWNFKALDCGNYTHDYANMAPTDVKITTDVKLKLVYVAEDCQDPVLFAAELEKSPNVT